MSMQSMIHERTGQFFRQFYSDATCQLILGDIERVLKSGRLMLGPFNERLETLVADYHGQSFAASVNSCTTALTITLRHFDVAEAEVLVPAANFISAVTAVIDAGGTPVLVDVIPETLSFDVADLQRKRTNKTRCVVWPHLLGVISPHWRNIVDFCSQHELPLIEDCAQAHGAEQEGRKAGSFGDASCLSFYSTKIVSCGNGGMVVTSDRELDARTRRLRLFGRDPQGGSITENGNDWFLDEFRAIVAYHHFLQVEESLAMRRRIAGWYHQYLANQPGISFLSTGPESSPAFYQFAVLLDEHLNRNAVATSLKDEFQVAAQGFYTPIHREPTLRHLDTGDLGGAESLMSRILCLPLHHELTEDDVAHVCQSLDEVIRRRCHP